MSPAGMDKRRFRVVAPHVPYLNRAAGRRPAEVVVASYPFEDTTYDFDEARDVLAIFTKTWRRLNWPPRFEPVMVSADEAEPEIRLTQQDLDDAAAADAYLATLAALSAP